MGIPFYFASLVRAYPGIVQAIRSWDRMEVDLMAIDFNCLIHRYIKEDNPVNSVLDALATIMQNVCNPKKCFVAFDGLVPYGKIVSQRYRRMRAPEGDEGTFDRNMISPETPYMKELSKELSIRFPNIVVSSTSESGEGEHKIFKYIKSLPEQDRKTITIYGLDADLILLSLAQHKLSKPHSMWLLRESSDFGDPKLKDAEFATLSIWKLLISLPIEIEQYLALCVMCFGNDFMPNLGMFSLRHEGYTRAIEIYKASGKPNLLTLEGRRTFLEHASKEEIKTLNEIIKTRKQPIERIVLGREPEDVSRRYGMHVLDGVTNMQPVVKAYWKSFHWVLHYFRTNDVINWNWVYPYPENPLITDIMKYPESFITHGSLNYNVKDQLQFILPATSLRRAKRIVKYHDEIYNETRHPWMKRYEWESKPRVSLPWNPEYDLTSVTEV